MTYCSLMKAVAATTRARSARPWTLPVSYWSHEGCHQRGVRWEGQPAGGNPLRRERPVRPDAYGRPRKIVERSLQQRTAKAAGR